VLVLANAWKPGSCTVEPHFVEVPWAAPKVPQSDRSAGVVAFLHALTMLVHAAPAACCFGVSDRLGRVVLLMKAPDVPSENWSEPVWPVMASIVETSEALAIVLVGRVAVVGLSPLGVPAPLLLVARAGGAARLNSTRPRKFAQPKGLIRRPWCC